MAGPVTVLAPATVANLGPGFDCLGLAVAWHNLLTVEAAPPGTLEVEASGPWAEGYERSDRNLSVRAIRRLLGPDVGLRLRAEVGVPWGRGFGSSATGIVAGLVAAQALAERGAGGEGPGGLEPDAVGPRELLALATEIEGHADNVAPCLQGGVAVVAAGWALPLPAPDDLRVLCCVAPGALATTAARAALPPSIPLSDATLTVGRAALLTAALATGTRDALLDATADTFHQPHRFRVMPESARLVEALREEGIAAFLSGAGPSVAALVGEADAPAAQERARSAAARGWTVTVASLDRKGARVVSSP